MPTFYNFTQDGQAYSFDDVFVTADLFRQGNIWSWGYNLQGQLGDNTIVNKSSPVQTIDRGNNWKQVSSADYYTAAIKTDGTLWTWGINNFGQLGNNQGGGGFNRSSPVQTVAGGTNWKQVSTGYNHTLAIKTNGTLWTWGNNIAGALGDGTTTNRSSPVQIFSGGTNWKQVDGGRYHSAAIKTDGTLWSWGENANGQLGDGTTTNRSSPVKIGSGINWGQVTCGDYITAAIKTDGTLWIWGRNTEGQLGDGTIVNKSSPVQTIAGGTNWKQVTAGGATAAAIKTDGRLWTWGLNNNGQLGDNTVVSKSSPVQTIAFGTNWKQVATSSTNSAAIKTNGTLWTWGGNASGNLGDGTIVNKSSPVQIGTKTNWKQVAEGSSPCMAIEYIDSIIDY